MDHFVDSREFARMTRAIEFIEREYERQPRLAEIARHVGLSEFHFNRLFRRWTGLTPKQYLAEVTSRAATPALRAEPSVMDAAHAVGLSGGGRLHDLTVTLEAMTPGEIRAAGEGVLIRHGVAATPFGSAFLAETPRGLCRLAFVEAGGERAELAQLRETIREGRFRARRRTRHGTGRNHLGTRQGENSVSRGRYQLPGASLACLARTRTARVGHIRRAGPETR
jgi:AraC family transcriptional regulator of adaptative response/methylated-DNA-[protein]-cysteine methyltransferase